MLDAGCHGDLKVVAHYYQTHDVPWEFGFQLMHAVTLGYHNAMHPEKPRKRSFAEQMAYPYGNPHDKKSLWDPKSAERRTLDMFKIALAGGFDIRKGSGLLDGQNEADWNSLIDDVRRCSPTLCNYLLRVRDGELPMPDQDELDRCAIPLDLAKRPQQSLNAAEKYAKEQESRAEITFNADALYADDIRPGLSLQAPLTTEGRAQTVTKEIN